MNDQNCKYLSPLKFDLHYIFENFENPPNFCENPQTIFVLFYDVHKENMFTINLEDGREAPYRTSIYKIVSEN